MARWTLRLTDLPVLALGLAGMGIAAAALTLGNGDAVVERGFERALASMGTQPSVRRPAGVTDVDTTAPFWLRHVVHDASTNKSKPLGVGDSITFNSGGRERVLHVVKVDKLDSSVLPVSSEQSAPLLLVTCQDQANPEARPVRFLIEAEDGLPTLSPVSAPRTL